MEKKLGEILAERGLLSKEYVGFALEVQKTAKLKLGEILIANGIVREEDVYDALAAQKGIGFLKEIDNDKIDYPVDPGGIPLAVQDITLMKRHLVVPLEGNILVVSDPSVVRNFAVKFGIRQVRIGPPSVILTAVESLYLRVYERGVMDVSGVSQDAIAEISGEFLDSIIRKAIIARASDIHFEAAEPVCYVRYRIDGDLIPQLSYSQMIHEKIANIILMRSLGNPSNNQRFDDAAFEYPLSSVVRVSIRVSKLPTKFGSSIVLRLLRQGGILHDLGELGLLEGQVQQLRKLMQRPYGMILLAGPTGAGKTTTLYSLANEIRGANKKTISIEDPVEVHMPFVEQVEVNPGAEITFDSAIRAFLRHDPDAIITGEIRDGETAGMAIEAAMTGHIVLATLHANNAFDVFTRLSDLGVSYKKMKNIAGVVSQRLVKKRCACIEGCVKCNYTRFYGRIAIAEVLEIDRELEDLLYEENMPLLIKKVREKGFRGIEEVAREYLYKGITEKEQLLGQIDIPGLTGDRETALNMEK